LGLLRVKWNRTNPAATVLAQLGVALASTLEPSAIANGAGVRKLARDVARWTTADQAAALIPADTGLATAKESATLSRAFSAYDDQRDNENRGRPFASLRAAYDDAGGKLTLEDLDARLLTEGQRHALPDALALADLMSNLEAPYRLWVTGQKASLPKTIATYPAWARVRAMGEPELVELHDELKGDPSLDALHRHQERVAARRGREPWVRGDPRAGRDKILPFDFTLGVTSSLFNEGVRPNHGG
jgi:hypothetical protein